MYGCIMMSIILLHDVHRYILHSTITACCFDYCRTYCLDFKYMLLRLLNTQLLLITTKSIKEGTQKQSPQQKKHQEEEQCVQTIFHFSIYPTR